MNDQLTANNLNLLNGIACIFWSGSLLVAIYRQKIRYSRHGWIVRSEAPKLFWVSIAVIGAIAIWTGAAFFLQA